MALILKPLFIFLTHLSFSLFFPLSLLPPHADATSFEFSTSVLNVTAALHQARQVLSFNPSYQEKETYATPTFSSSSTFKLQLHPTDSMFNAQQHKDYRSLVLARLSRDSARVSWILSKLQQHKNKSENLSGPVASGFSKGLAEYYVRIGVGQPAQPFDLVLDTGSPLNWLQCKPCSHCYNQSDPIFDPSVSSSYSLITCEAKQCKHLETSFCNKDRYCGYNIMYGDSSRTEGVLVTETVSFGNTGSINQVPMGCAHNSQGPFTAAAGILALGRDPLSFPSRINASSFSYCFVPLDSKGSSTLEFNSPRPGDSLTAPLLTNPKMEMFYYVGFTGVSVGGQNVSVPQVLFKIQPSGDGGIIVDSGTTITILYHKAYNMVRDAFVVKTPHLRRAKALSIFDTCYDLSSETVVKVPTVSFVTSDGKSWGMPTLVPMDDKGTFCFAFAPTKVPISILGNAQQQGTRVTFDLANSVIGFSPHKCS